MQITSGLGGHSLSSTAGVVERFGFRGRWSIMAARDLIGFLPKRRYSLGEVWNQVFQSF